MKTIGTLQDWITGFEAEMKRRFSVDLKLVVFRQNHLIDLAAVVRIVSNICDVDYDDILGRSKKVEIVNARMISMYLCYKYISPNYSHVARFHGGRHHTTAIWSISSVNNRKDVQDALLVSKLKECEEGLTKMISKHNDENKA